MHWILVLPGALMLAAALAFPAAADFDRGVAQNFVLAYMWATLAAAQDAENAEENRARIAKRLSAEQIAEAARMAAAWQPEE